MYQRHFEDIIRYFNEHHPDELTRARQDFFSQTGEVYDDDPFYEDRVSNFLEWFVFDRPFGEDTSAAHHYRRLNDGLSPEDLETLDALCQPVHGLFEVRRLLPKKHRVVLRDLRDHATYEITERRTLAGLNKNGLFEARLVMRDDQWHFMRAFVMFPDETRGFLKKQMKRMRKAGIEDFRPYFMDLQKVWMKCQRYAHVDPMKFYTDDEVEFLHAG